MISKQEHRGLKMVQNRAEELLLELILERFNTYVTNLERPADLTNQEENTEFYRGYYDATYDAMQRLREIVDEFNEVNGYQL